MKKEFIKLSGILCAITLIAALLLACVNKVTAPEIAQASQKASENAMKTIIADAESFEKITDTVFKGTSKGEIIGYCATVTVNGFGGPVEMMVGIGTDNTVKGIEILSHSETAGLGAKATSKDFKDRFPGKNPNLSVVKTPTESQDEVQAITGATITSKAVAEGIRQAYESINEVKGGDK